MHSRHLMRKQVDYLDQNEVLIIFTPESKNHHNKKITLFISARHPRWLITLFSTGLNVRCKIFAVPKTLS